MIHSMYHKKLWVFISLRVGKFFISLYGFTNHTHTHTEHNPLHQSFKPDDALVVLLL